MQPPFAYEVRAMGICSIYYGTSFKEAEEVFIKSKVSCQFVQRIGNKIKVINQKSKDRFPGIFEKAFKK